MTMANAGGPYRVPKRHGGTRAFALAVVMHGVLFAFLWVGIRWNNDPVGFDAEIWDMTTQMAAPQAPQYAILALVFASVDLVAMFGYALLGAQATAFLKQSGAVWLDRLCGGALLALAGSLALYRRATA